MKHSIRLLILDVDGVLTDGRLVMVESGPVVKAFHVLDGGGIRLWRDSGREAAILTARTSPAVQERARELGIEIVEQGSDHKVIGYERIRDRLRALDQEICYIGDDFLDLAPMRRCGYPVAVANAAVEVKRAAEYVTEAKGGAGAVREVVRHLIRRAGEWRKLIAAYEISQVRREVMA